MLKEKKEYSRSIRMTQTIKNYVEQTEGNGFNDKLEKLCAEMPGSRSRNWIKD